jgi:3'-phosphoadenosine 5'-phosphosulfate sulfotransferase (PAPS reductase)/FAD synthetase
MVPVPDDNPYVPTWPKGGKVTETARKKRAAITRAYRQDKKHRRAELARIRELRDEGALFVVSHSGGKDSQATMIAVQQLVPDDQIIVVHAPLAHIEWEGSEQAARADAGRLPFLLADKYNNVGEEVWLLERVVSKCKWPDQSNRWCTGEWKRGPIAREVGQWADKNGFTKIVEAWGLRAEESPKRALQAPISEHFRHGTRSVKLKEEREWYVWLPVKWMTTEEVFDSIHGAGKKPLWTYDQGMSRASCAFCIIGAKPDLQIAARLAPDLYALYVAVEKYLAHCQREMWEAWGPRRKGWMGVKGAVATKKEQKARRRPPHPDPGTIKRRAGNTSYPIEQFVGLAADPKMVERYYKAILATGDLSGIELPQQVQRPAPKRLRQLRALRERRHEYGQMRLEVPVGVWG